MDELNNQEEPAMASNVLRKVWLITGTSAGLGRQLALEALARGDRVIATARSLDKIRHLQEANPERCRVLQLDVTDDFETLSKRAAEANQFWGGTDIVVNNAGYGLFGTLEGGGVEALMKMYQTNVFGVVNVTNAFLPYMRERKSGTIVLIGSRSAFRTHIPGIGFYSSSKAAVHAIIETLREEVKPYKIRVMNAIPGAMRTDGVSNALYFKHRPLLVSPTYIPGRYDKVPEYEDVLATIAARWKALGGHEPGDAVKMAKVIVDAVRGEGSAAGRPFPENLFLGTDCKVDVTEKCQNILKALEEWDDITCGVDVSEE